MSHVTLRLSSRSFPAHAKPRDYDHWIGYVIQTIEAKSGFAVDEIEAAPWGAEAETFASMDASDHSREILEAVQALWDAFKKEHMTAPTEQAGGEP
jgi:hypothetical protein